MFLVIYWPKNVKYRGRKIMGKYRFMLSIFVALSHIGTYFAGINQGVVSVVSFLLISGFTMQKSADKFFRERVVSSRQIINFYFDRIMRIYPQYIFSAF